MGSVSKQSGKQTGDRAGARIGAPGSPNCSLEHGAVWITYNGRATPDDIKTLSDKVKVTPHSFMSPLTARGTQLVLHGAKDPRVERFFTKYVQGPQTREPGASCTAGSMPVK